MTRRRVVTKTTALGGNVRIRRKSVVTVETDEAWFIRYPAVMAWCAECGRQVQMVSPDGAAFMTPLSMRDIDRQVEAGMIHYTETEEGFLLICVNSITETAAKNTDQFSKKIRLGGKK